VAAATAIDEQYREEIDASNEAVEEQSLVQRQEIGERAKGRPSEVEDEPQHEEDEREEKKPRARHERGDDPHREERREHRKASVIEEVA